MKNISPHSLILTMALIASITSYMLAQQTDESFIWEEKKYQVTGSSNLISNPTFDSGLSDWYAGDNTALSATKFTVNSTGGVDNGAYLVGLVNEGGGASGSIGTGWPIEKGKTYYFSFYAKYLDLSKPAGAEPYLKVSLTNTIGTTEDQVLVSATSFDNEGVWTKNEIVFTNTEGYAFLQCRFRWLNNQFGFDEFTLTEVTEVFPADELKALIDEAESILDEGAGDKAVKLQSAITLAKTFLTSSSPGEIDLAISNLKKAMSSYKYAGASVSNPFNMTSFITNPTMDSSEGWTSTTGARNQGLATNQYGDFVGSYWENWNQNAFVGKIYQKIDNLPLGLYELKAAVFSNNTGGVYLYANDAEKLVVLNNDGSVNIPTYQTLRFFLSDNTLEIGLNIKEYISNWVGLDNVSLMYLGDASMSSESNLLAGWDAYGVIGENSRPNDFGWNSTSINLPPWNTANAVNGVRYMDPGNSEYVNYYFPEKDVNDIEKNRYDQNRILWIRWDSDITQNSVYTYPVNIEAEKRYTFSWKYAWHNNGTVPTLKVSFCTNSDGTGEIASHNFIASDIKRILTEGYFTFESPVEASFMTISANTAALVAIADLSLAESGSDVDPFFNVSASSLFFSNSATNLKQKTFTVSGVTEEMVTLTPPEGITLSKNVIGISELAYGRSVQVTATYAVTTAIDDSIIVKSGNFRKSIIVKAKPENPTGNLIHFWDADGTFGAGSEPNNYGWIGSNITDWKQAVFTGGDGIRYTEKYAGITDYVYNDGTPFVGRIFYIRWDGIGNSNTSTVYAYPVRLKAGHSYTFSGLFAWNSNATNDGIPASFVFDINSMSDATGTSLYEEVYPIWYYFNDIHSFEEISFEFTADRDAEYYLTIRNDKAILGALAELSIVDHAGPSISTSVNSLVFVSDSENRTPSKTFEVKGSGLTEDVTLIAPSGIVLDKTSLTASEVNSGVTVTATFRGDFSIQSAFIELLSGNCLKKIFVGATATKIIDTDKLYNIIHSSGNYLGYDDNDPENVKILQGFQDNNVFFKFVPSGIKEDVYHIQEISSMHYISKIYDNNWSMYWSDFPYDANTQFTIEPIGGDTVRIKCLARNNLGTDGNEAGAFVYADKDGYDPKHYWVLKAASQDPIPYSEYEALLAIYHATHGEAWYKKWIISENDLHINSWHGVTIRNGHVIGIVLPNNNLTGYLPVDLKDLPYLQTLDLSGNSISSMDSALPSTITSLNLGKQSFNKGTLNLPGTIQSSDIPDISTYDHLSQSSEMVPMFNIYISGLKLNSDPLTTENLVSWFSNIDENIRLGLGQNIELRQINGTAANTSLYYTITYKSGDANIDGLVNIQDLQQIINYMQFEKPVPFNFKAADIIADDRVNIQDVIGSVNLIQSSGLENYSVLKSSSVSTSELTVENGVVYLYSPSDISAFDIRISEGLVSNIQSLINNVNIQVSIKESGKEISILAFSISGDVIPAGEKTALFTIGTEQTIHSAMLVNISAQVVETNILQAPTEIKNTKPENFNLLNTPNPFKEQTEFIYSLKESAVFAQIRIFDQSGSEVDIIRNLPVEIGENRVTYINSKLAEGVYLYRLETSKNNKLQISETKKMLIQK